MEVSTAMFESCSFVIYSVYLHLHIVARAVHYHQQYQVLKKSIIQHLFLLCCLLILLYHILQCCIATFCLPFLTRKGQLRVLKWL